MSVAPAVRAVTIAWATIRGALLLDPARPALSRIPAMTGADPGVLIIVTSGDKPYVGHCFPAVLVCPYAAPCSA